MSSTFASSDRRDAGETANSRVFMRIVRNVRHIRYTRNTRHSRHDTPRKNL